MVMYVLIPTYGYYNLGSRGYDPGYNRLISSTSALAKEVHRRGMPTAEAASRAPQEHRGARRTP
eukprot:6140586-Lingulodinium_polyedra.AAC.1